MLVYCTGSIVGFWWNVNFHAWLAVLHDVFSVLFSQIQLQSETVQKLQLPEAMQSFANGVQALHISSGWMNFLSFPLWLKVPGTSKKGRVWIQRICWRRLHMHSHGAMGVPCGVGRASKDWLRCLCFSSSAAQHGGNGSYRQQQPQRKAIDMWDCCPLLSQL